MCRFLSLDFAMDLKCPVDRANHRVRFQSYPSLGLHPLDVLSSATRSHSMSNLRVANSAGNSSSLANTG
jgi:hypothetical protein